MDRTHRLGELQLAIMRVLWELGEATVAEVREGLEPDKRRAPTTIATMLTKMERKGVVTHRTERRRFVYRAVVGEDDVHRTMVQSLVDNVFQGSKTALVHHLLNEGEIDSDELDELRALIDERENGPGGRDGS